MRAIICAKPRDELIDLARELQEVHVTLFAPTPLYDTLQIEGISAHPLTELAPSPALLHDELQALHPALFAAVLARRDRGEDEEELKRHAITPIDMVVVDLSAVEIDTTVPLAAAETLAQIDITGAALARAAARNFADVIVLVRPQDYATVMQEWREQGEVSLETRRRLAAIAFRRFSSYDSAIAASLAHTQGERFPDELTLSLQRVQPLRYGENPHQQATLYRWSRETRSGATPLPTVANAELLQGRDLSYNNLLDLDVALTTVQSFTAPTIAIVKHTNPCGVACDDNLIEAYHKAHAGDPISTSGGIIGSNRPIDETVAHQIAPLFYDAVIAPEFTPAALQILSAKRSLRLLATHCPIHPKEITTHLLIAGCPEVRSISGGLLVQAPDVVGDGEVEYRVVSEREPNLEEVTDLMFAWKVVRCVKSNAIVLAHKLAIVGVGAGQMNRLTSVQLAIEKAGTRAHGTTLASDAFFPFPDGVEAAARAGITAIIQPGGSLRDEEAIRMANRYAVAMIMTGKRHFRH